MKRKLSSQCDAAPSLRQHREPQATAPTAAGPANLSEGCRLTAARARITSLAPPPKAQGTARQQALGRLGGTCAGFLGSNKFAVEVATDGRSRCQLRSCKIPLKIGELRLGKRPPSRPVWKSTSVILHEVVMNWHRASVASMAWRATRRFSTNANFHTGRYATATTPR